MMRNEEPPNKEVHAADLAEALGRLGTAGAGSDQQLGSAAAAATAGVHHSTVHNMAESGARQHDPDTPVSVSSDVHMHGSDQEGGGTGTGPGTRTYTWPAGMGRERSGSSTVIYDPEHHGGSPHLPAVMVEDTTISIDVSDTEIETSPGSGQRIIAHTSRPPVELMD